MPTTEQDARALAFLAKRLRDETYGAGTWDDPGIWTECRALIGSNLAIAIERVTRHAADPNAKTPGAIRRPYTPDAPAAPTRRNPSDPRTTCGICGKDRTDCERTESAIPADRHRFVARMEDRGTSGSHVAELRAALANAQASTEGEPE